MKSIGIIVNPNSGKDIRRLSSHSLTIGNNEKANLVERLVLGAQRLGVNQVYFMPDDYHIGTSIKNRLIENAELKCDIKILDFKHKGNEEDTLLAAKLYNEIKVNCIIILGGDGTSRLVATTKTSIPLISVSTGTNNVYPKFSEGTILGMAAAALCEYGINKEYIRRDKIIEVYKNGTVVNYALIDVAISTDKHTGARAIDKFSDIDELIVSRCSPASIGYSSILGVQSLALPEDPFGYRGKIFQREKGNRRIIAPFSAGNMVDIWMDKPIKMDLNYTYVYKPSWAGTIALDGEKTVSFKEDDILGFTIRKNGPFQLDVDKILQYAASKGFFVKSKL